MDRIQKFLLKLDRDRRSIYMEIFQDIRILNLGRYDVQPLKGFKGLFRLRKGKIKIVFTKQNNMGVIVNADFRGGVYKGI